MLQYWIWFAENQELNIPQKQMLLEHFSDPEEIYHARADKLPDDWEALRPILEQLKERELEEAARILKECSHRGIRILTYLDPEYPKRLRNIDEPPMVLYYRGQLPDFEAMPSVGVVGTRKATAYGLGIARRMSSQIAACGALVVSGGAYGIDAVAMQGALDAGCPVVGVLGCGVDVVYPKANRQLFEAVLKKGCLISEYPPETPGYPWNFPRRNRIISGMSNGILVVEAPEKSGALITARLAFDQGRDVFVVPGNIDVASCAGSNALLQERALAVFSGWDVVKEYAALYPGKLEKREAAISEDSENPSKIAQKPALPRDERPNKIPKNKKIIDKEENCPYSGIKDIISALSGEEKELAALLDNQPRPVDEIIARSGLSAGRVLSLLTVMALKGVVTNHPGRAVSLKTK